MKQEKGVTSTTIFKVLDAVPERKIFSAYHICKNNKINYSMVQRALSCLQKLGVLQEVETSVRGRIYYKKNES